MRFRIVIPAQVLEFDDDSETDAISKAVAEMKYTIEEVPDAAGS